MDALLPRYNQAVPTGGTVDEPAAPVCVHVAADLEVAADDAAEVDMLRENCRRLVYSFDLGGVSSGSTLVLKVMRSKGKINHIAIDEIRLKP